MPHIRHVCVLLPLVMHNIRYVHLGLYIGASLKGRTTHTWSFGCGFAWASAVGYAGFKISFGLITLL